MISSTTSSTARTASYFEREPSFCHGCAFNPSGNEPAAVPRNALALGQQALRDGDTATADDHFRRIATDPVITEAEAEVRPGKRQHV